MEKNAKIYVAGHRGMVGSAIVRELQRQGYTNIITRTHKELDLTRQEAVERFFAEEKARICIPRRSKGGRYHRQPIGIGGLHVREHDIGDECHPLGMAQWLQEAGVSRFIVHIPAYGTPADA